MVFRIVPNWRIRNAGKWHPIEEAKTVAGVGNRFTSTFLPFRQILLNYVA